MAACSRQPCKVDAMVRSNGQACLIAAFWSVKWAEAKTEFWLCEHQFCCDRGFALFNF